jgi:hypothetical protein
MFKWLDRWLTRKIHSVIMTDDEKTEFDMGTSEDDFPRPPQKGRGRLSTRIRNRLDGIEEPFPHEHGMRFTIYQASGGLIVQYTQYDEKINEAYHALHIITNDMDIGEALSKIITIEHLRK